MITMYGNRNAAATTIASTASNTAARLGATDTLGIFLIGSSLITSAEQAASQAQKNHSEVHQPSPNCTLATSGRIAMPAAAGAGITTNKVRREAGHPPVQSVEGGGDREQHHRDVRPAVKRELDRGQPGTDPQHSHRGGQDVQAHRPSGAAMGAHDSSANIVSPATAWSDSYPLKHHNCASSTFSRDSDKVSSGWLRGRTARHRNRPGTAASGA